jgi:hypothetical protein
VIFSEILKQNSDKSSYPHPHVNTVQASTAHARYPAGILHGEIVTSNYSPINGNSNNLGGEYEHEASHYSGASNSHTASTYNASPTTSYSTESEYANLPHVDLAYYPSDTAAYAHTTYASTISIEYDQNGGYVAGRPNSGKPVSDHVHSPGHSTQHDIHIIDQQHSLSMRRWSLENSPEERIRIGLPRWESEQHRIAYEQGNMREPSDKDEQSNTPEPSNGPEHAPRRERRRTTRQRSRTYEHH